MRNQTSETFGRSGNHVVVYCWSKTTTSLIRLFFPEQTTLKPFVWSHDFWKQEQVWRSCKVKNMLCRSDVFTVACQDWL